MIARRYRLHVSGSQMRQTEGPLLKMQVPRAPVHVLVQVSVRWAQEIVAEMASRPPCGKPCSGRTRNTQRSVKTTIGKAGQSADTPRAPTTLVPGWECEGGREDQDIDIAPTAQQWTVLSQRGGQVTNCTWGGTKLGSQTAHRAVHCHSQE